MARDLVALDKKHVWHPFTQMREWVAGAPLVIERGDGNYLIDTDGNRYLDGVSSLWVNVHGHNDPTLNGAIRAQLDKIAHTTLLGLASPPSIELAERLVELAPGALSRVFYSDSGSTAVEIALKQAFQYWQLRGRREKTRFAYLADAYHGDTLGAVAVGGIPVFHEVFAPIVAHGGDRSLCLSNAQDGATPEERCARALEQAKEVFERRGHGIAALIVEPLVQGAAGMLTQPPGFLRGLWDLCRTHEVLLIADEVATGFGRTGTMFACEQEGVEPDFLCLAKGLTGGYLPLAATLTTDEVYEAFLGTRAERKTFFHGHTYTGNPLACAAALASLALFETRDVLASVAQRSRRLEALLVDRIDPLPNVREIRQRGLMVGIELCAEGGEDLPADQASGAAVCAETRNHGVLLRPLGDVIVLMPPLSVTDQELGVLVDAVVKAMRTVLG